MLSDDEAISDISLFQSLNLVFLSIVLPELCFQSSLPRVHAVRVCVCYVRPSGFEVIRDAVGHCFSDFRFKVFSHTDRDNLNI